MTSRLIEIVIDGHDLRMLAEFWCAVLGYHVIEEEEGIIEIAPPDFPAAWTDESLRERRAQFRAAPGTPTIVFISVPEHKTVKNRVHIDVSPLGSQDEEVERLLSLGATRADIGQGDAGWVVMRDPEGNEFCVLRSLEA